MSSCGMLLFLFKIWLVVLVLCKAGFIQHHSALNCSRPEYEWTICRWQINQLISINHKESVFVKKSIFIVNSSVFLVARMRHVENSKINKVVSKINKKSHDFKFLEVYHLSRFISEPTKKSKLKDYLKNIITANWYLADKLTVLNDIL